MKEYMEKLYHKLHEAMEKPVTLGSAEEVMVYADTICALHKLGDDHFRESTKMMEFTEDDAKAWTARMKNADGRCREHGHSGTSGPALGVGRDHEHDVLGLLPRRRRVRHQPPGVLRCSGQGVPARQGRPGAGAQADGVL